MSINEELAKKQKITDEQRKNLDSIYNKMEELFDVAKSVNSSDLSTDLKFYISHKLAEGLKKLEYKLQKNWNFPQDARYHVWWNRLYGCKCPKLDNEERFGQDKFISNKCPYHGFKTKSKKTKSKGKK